MNPKRLSLIKHAQVLIIIILFNSIVYSFESELWPGEGIPTFRAIHDSLILYKEPSILSPKIKLHNINKDDIITYDKTLFRTVKPGIIIAQSSGKFYGRSFGNITYLSNHMYYHESKKSMYFTYELGDSIRYLQYRAEGSCIIQYKGEILEVDDCLWNIVKNEKQFKKISDNTTEWWIRITNSNNKPIGWLLLDEKSVENLGRRF